MGRYAPWLLAACSTVVIVVARLRTNQMVLDRLRVSQRLSAVYMVGFVSLTVSFFWAIFRIAWWGCLPVLGLYAVFHFLIPARLPGTMGDPVTAHSVALMQAAEELGAFPPKGPEQAQRLMQRADEIMRSQGWKPRDPQG